MVEKPVGGMIVSLGVMYNVVAADNGKWITLTVQDAEKSVTREVTPQGVTGVAALSFDNSNKTVIGMLFGDPNETVMEGAVNAYMAHVMKPLERDARLRKENNPYLIQSFAIGDVVRQTVQSLAVGEQLSDSTAAIAVVVRVLYYRRGNQQARRMLILLELSGDPPYSLPQRKSFFPASWCNWTHVLDNEGKPSESVTTLPKNTIKDLDNVRGALGTEASRYACSTLSTLVVVTCMLACFVDL